MYMNLFKVTLYSKDYVVKDPKLRYESGEVYAYSGHDSGI